MPEDLTVVNFTNIDHEDYEGMWGGEVTVIKARETKQFPKFLAEHFCKHLVNKMLIRGGQDWSAGDLRKPLEDKILGTVSAVAEEEVKPEKEEIVFEETPKEEAPKEEVKEEEPKEQTEVKPKRKGGRKKKEAVK